MNSVGSNWVSFGYEIKYKKLGTRCLHHICLFGYLPTKIEALTVAAFYPSLSAYRNIIAPIVEIRPVAISGTIIMIFDIIKLHLGK